ncbi:MAG: hypothetical protein HC836_38430, partial [Richelia sp. RM2_1_2]|nr:hypothetical protein [Richelia sp. RM2_1_2]
MIQIQEVLDELEAKLNERINAAIAKSIKLCNMKLKAIGIEPGVVIIIKESPEYKYVIKDVSYVLSDNHARLFTAFFWIQTLNEDETEGTVGFKLS